MTTHPGETAAKAADGDVNSKWLDFHPTGWLNLTFPKATTVKRYALVSANDGRSGTPGAWQLYDSNDGITLDHPDTKTGQNFDRRFQARAFDIPTPRNTPSIA